MKLSLLLGAVAALSLSIGSMGCSHAVNINSSPPGAEIYVEGQKVGTAPTTYTETTAGNGTSVNITAKQNGKEKKVAVPRQSVAMMPILAGAGAGTGACMAMNVVAGIAGFVFPPCWAGNCASILLIPAGAGAGWYLYGNQLPDQVTVDMADAAPAESPPPAAGVAPPAANY